MPWRPFRGGVSPLEGLRKASGGDILAYMSLRAGVPHLGLAEAAGGGCIMTAACLLTLRTSIPSPCHICNRSAISLHMWLAGGAPLYSAVDYT